MDERREADVPWASAPLAPRIAIAAVVAVPAALMAYSLSGSRGIFFGALLGLFWGLFEVLVIVFPRTLQRWSRQQALFNPMLMLGLLLFGLLFLTSMPTSIAVFFSLVISGMFALISVWRRRRPAAPPPPPTRGRRHS